MSAISRVADHSPTAQLLRHSRLFSVPQPLPRPDLSRTHGTDKRVNSPTATTPFPTHQAIGTTNTAKQRGDWGLKRSLPLTSTANKRAITMQMLDTNDEITEFESGHAHVMTLRKLQEMNLPIRRFLTGNSNDQKEARSAFDEDVDNTAPKPLSLKESRLEKEVQSMDSWGREVKLSHRWRSRGPDLRNVPESKFEGYLAYMESVSPDFLRFLKAYYVQSKAIDEWEHRPPSKTSEVAETSEMVEASEVVEPSEMLKGPENLMLSRIEQLHISFLRSLTLEELQAYLLDPFLKSLTPEKLETYLQAEYKRKAAWTSQIPSNVQFDPVMEEHKSEVFVASRQGFKADKLAKALENLGDIDSADNNSSLSKVDPEVVSRLKSTVEEQFREYLDAQFPKFLTEFRSSAGKIDEYRNLIEYFLDLPATIPKNGEKRPEMSTHPAAGLSYRRADSSLRNHPIFGPLRHREPYQARLMPSGPMGGSTAEYVSSNNQVGVAGLIAKAPGRASGVPWAADLKIARAPKTYNVETGEAEIPERGTSKGWIIPSQVVVNENGRVMMTVEKLPDPGQFVVENELQKAMDRDEEIELTGGSVQEPLQYQRVVPVRPLDEKVVKDGRLSINLNS